MDNPIIGTRDISGKEGVVFFFCNDELPIVLDALRAFTVGIPERDETRLTLMAMIESELAGEE